MKQHYDDIKYFSTDGCCVYSLAEIALIAGREMVANYLFYPPSFMQVA